MDQYFGKKYKLKTSENFDEYLKYIDVGIILRKLALSLSPVNILTKNEDGTYTLYLNTPVKKVAITFRNHEEFDEERADGAKVKSIMIVEGNKVTHKQTDKNGRKSQHLSEYNGDLLTVTTTADGWDEKCIRTYELVED